METWKTVYTHLTKIYDKYASSEYKQNLKELEKEAGYGYVPIITFTFKFNQNLIHISLPN